MIREKTRRRIERIRSRVLVPLFFTLNIPVFMSLCTRVGTTSSADEATATLTDTLYSPRFASRFLLTCSPDSSRRMITSLKPWQGAGDVSTRLLLLPEGEKASTEERDLKVLSGVPRRIVCMSSTHVAMLSALGAADRIVGVSGAQYITTPGIIGTDRKVADVGYEGNIDYEALAGARPDLVLLSAASGRSAMEGKLDELGIPYIYMADYTESSPLGKTEWVVPLAEILGMRSRGRAVIDSIAPLYRQWHLMARDAVKDMARRPKVMLNAPYADAWVLPPDDSYTVRLLNDAGAVMVSSNPTDAAKTIDMEEAWTLLASADFWLNPGQAASLASLKSMAPRAASTKVFGEGRVYNNNRLARPGSGNPFFEQGVMQPDVVLADLVTILHPELSTDHTPVYYTSLK